MATRVPDGLILDSASEGDPQRFLPLDTLADAFASMPAAPSDSGTVVAVVVRADRGRRVLPTRARLTRGGGLEGDAWARDPGRVRDAQITVMQAGVAELLANGQPLALFGDNLFLDLDLSEGNLPVGSTLQAGTAVLEVTPKPHNGCSKFRGRVGADALRFVSSREQRHRNLRGIYARVIVDGELGVGDRVDVLWRGAGQPL